jgi:hypothetical protein
VKAVFQGEISLQEGLFAPRKLILTRLNYGVKNRNVSEDNGSALVEPTRKAPTMA